MKREDSYFAVKNKNKYKNKNKKIVQKKIFFLRESEVKVSLGRDVEVLTEEGRMAG
jgi:hypothetical protein